MDLFLVLLIAFTALYAGCITLLVQMRRQAPARAVLMAAAAAVGVAVSFLLMVLLAHVALPATMAVAALFAAVVAYAALLPDFGRARSAGAAVAAALLIGTSFALVSYLAVMAFIGAVGVYHLLRLRLRSALLVMGGTLGGLLAAAALVFSVTLSTM